MPVEGVLRRYSARDLVGLAKQEQAFSVALLDDLLQRIFGHGAILRAAMFKRRRWAIFASS